MLLITEQLLIAYHIKIPWIKQKLSNTFYVAYINAIKSLFDACSIILNDIYELNLSKGNQDLGKKKLWEELEKKDCEAFKKMLPFKENAFKLKEERDVIIHRNHRVFHCVGSGDPNTLNESDFEVKMVRNPDVDISAELRKGNKEILIDFSQKLKEDAETSFRVTELLLNFILDGIKEKNNEEE